MKEKVSIQHCILCFLLGVLSMTIISRVTTADCQAKHFAPEETQIIAEEVESVESADPIRDVMGVAPSANDMWVEEAECLSKVVSGIDPYLPKNLQLAIFDCIFNRVDCSYGLFGDTVVEVCTKPQQWQGYSDDNPVIESIYDTAQEALFRWRNGGARSIPTDCYWMEVEYNKIVFRTDFDKGSAKCNFWEVEGKTE